MRRFVASLFAIIVSASASASTLEAQRPEFQRLFVQYNAALTSADVEGVPVGVRDA